MLVVYLIIGIIVLGGIIYYNLVLSKKFNPQQRAEEFLKGNQLKEAIREYEKILENDPFDSVTTFRLANLYQKINNIDEAARYFEKVIDLNKYSFEVNKLQVYNSLARIFLHREDVENAFRLYSEIVREYPGDDEALYNCAFICLGQEEFDISQRFFERLVKETKMTFEIAFGAGISSYQNQKINESVEFFKKAIELKSDSDIANIAMAFAQKRKRDFKKALPYLDKLVVMVKDPEVLFAVMRLDAFINIHLKKPKEAVAKFEAIANFAANNDLFDEQILSYYDLGFACINDEQTHKAYEYWNKLAELNRNYRNIQGMIMTLRREMSDEIRSPFDERITDKVNDWLENAFPQNFLWEICGLKAETKFNVKMYFVSTKSAGAAESSVSTSQIMHNADDMIQEFAKLDVENFKIISGRVIDKLGYRVSEILNTYKDSDGCDFLAVEKSSGNKVLVWVRRWKQTIGEIPLRNFAQAVNDARAAYGLFITTSYFTEGATQTAANFEKIKLFPPDELNTILHRLM